MFSFLIYYILFYTAKNAEDLLPVNFMGLLQLVIKFVNFIKLQQVCENKARCNLSFADFLQFVETTCSQPGDNNQQTSHDLQVFVRVT